jgi:hypothetical protein
MIKVQRGRTVFGEVSGRGLGSLLVFVRRSWRCLLQEFLLARSSDSSSKRVRLTTSLPLSGKRGNDLVSTLWQTTFRRYWSVSAWWADFSAAGWLRLAMRTALAGRDASGWAGFASCHSSRGLEIRPPVLRSYRRSCGWELRQSQTERLRDWSRSASSSARPQSESPSGIWG